MRTEKVNNKCGQICRPTQRGVSFGAYVIGYNDGTCRVEYRTREFEGVGPRLYRWHRPKCEGTEQISAPSPISHPFAKVKWTTQSVNRLGGQKKGTTGGRT